MLTKLFKTRLVALSLCAVLIAMLPGNAHAWGLEGHRITARIAAMYVNPVARAEIIKLLRTDIRNNAGYYRENCSNVLGLGKKRTLTKKEEEAFLVEGMACIAPWPDPPVKSQRNYTSNWHFVDIPVVMNNPGGSDHPLRFKYDPSRDCIMDAERGDCAAQALERLRAVLGNPKIPSQKGHEYGEEMTARAEALKFFVHIVGDIHQPLHCVTDKKDEQAVSNPKDLGDMGGNLKIATWFGEPKTPYGLMNIHSIWDGGIITHTMKVENLTETQYYQNLLKAIPARGSRELAEMQKGDFYIWFEETYDLAVRQAYGKLPRLDPNCGATKDGKLTGCYQLADDYYNANKGFVDQQLMMGGVRLGRLLNDILGKPVS
jgi:S1/P1 Nuclease